MNDNNPQLNNPEQPTRAALACTNHENGHIRWYELLRLPREQFIQGRTDRRELSCRDLRYWLLLQIHNQPDAVHRVAELVTSINEAGFVLTGRASKTVSDALHTETARGRIQRVGWGRYRAAGTLPPTSRRRITIRLNQVTNDLRLLYLRAGQREFAQWERRTEIAPGQLAQPVREVQPGPHPQLKIGFRPRVLTDRKVASPTENPINAATAPDSCSPTAQPKVASPTENSRALRPREDSNPEPTG